MKYMALVAFALVGTAGIAHAQQSGAPTPKAAACADPHQVALTDEYGFRYDNRGDRLNTQGCVIAPPQTQPGAGVAKN